MKTEVLTQEPGLHLAETDERVTVTKAWKMYVGGEFIRSESGRTYSASSQVASADPQTVNIPSVSRKDIRDAVTVAKQAQGPWAGKTAYNRGQILYRLAEMMEARASELGLALFREGIDAVNAEREVAAAIDRTVYYAGFADKYASLLASSNPVAGPHFAFSVPESIGVIAVLPDASLPLLGPLTLLLPLLCAGNSVIVMASQEKPRVLLSFAEIVATSDFTKGVVNILSGSNEEAALHFSSHRELDGIWAFNQSESVAKTIKENSADRMKRVWLKQTDENYYFSPESASLTYLENATESKAIWHPKGI